MKLLVCTSCKTEEEPLHARNRRAQWWFCSDYFGISGCFCPTCYDQISHDSYGQPRYPKAYQIMKERLNERPGQ